jgi:hypothetical protein
LSSMTNQARNIPKLRPSRAGLTFSRSDIRDEPGIVCIALGELFLLGVVIPGRAVAFIDERERVAVQSLTLEVKRDTEHGTVRSLRSQVDVHPARVRVVASGVSAHRRGRESGPRGFARDVAARKHERTGVVVDHEAHSTSVGLQLGSQRQRDDLVRASWA